MPKSKPSPEWIQAGQKFLSRDPAFKAIIKQLPTVPLKAMKKFDLFQALTHAIINQQISGAAADAIHKRVSALFPSELMSAELLLELSTEQLRAAGLSFNKIRFLKDLALHIVEERVPKGTDLHALTDEILHEKLTAILGIGSWTVHMLQIFKLGRQDVFPAADIGVQRGFQRLYRKRQRPTTKFLETFSKRWKPYRTLAAWYLWRAAEEAAFNPVEGDLLWTKTHPRK